MTTTTTKYRANVPVGPADDDAIGYGQQRLFRVPEADPGGYAPKEYVREGYRDCGLSVADFIFAHGTAASSGRTIAEVLRADGWTGPLPAEDFHVRKRTDWNNGSTSWEMVSTTPEPPRMTVRQARQRPYGWQPGQSAKPVHPTPVEAAVALVKRVAMSGTERSRLSRARQKAAKAAQEGGHPDAS